MDTRKISEQEKEMPKEPAVMNTRKISEQEKEMPKEPAAMDTRRIIEQEKEMSKRTNSYGYSKNDGSNYGRKSIMVKRRKRH
jgi:hypothetical protein